MIKNKLIILFCVFIICSCRPEADISPFLTSDSLIDDVENGMVKIGQKLDNPYSVKNMSKAYQNLLESDEYGKIHQEARGFMRLLFTNWRMPHIGSSGKTNGLRQRTG